MKVLFAASEAHPFIKTGGLGDVMGALPKSLIKLGVDVRVVIPKYKNIKDEFKQKLQFIKWFTVPVGWRNQYCGVFQYQYKGVIYYFIDNEYYFNRDGLYGYYDDGERFVFFSRAVLEMLRVIDFKPDIINANDWQTALIPVYYHIFYKYQQGYDKIKNVFTIHNIQYQGQYDRQTLNDLMGIPMYHSGLLEFDGRINLMKGAIETADMVTTVSPSYAWEILDPWYSYGLDRAPVTKQYKLKGILNGIDTAYYNPESDLSVADNYSVNDISGKSKCKYDLLKLTGLSTDDKPLIGIVTRLVSHKGIDLIKYVLEELVGIGCKFAVLGSGEKIYEDFFREMNSRYPDRVSVTFGFNHTLSKQIYAGADMFLMPSQNEPCGLAQMIAMRYGTIPVVRETGGLRDSVHDNGDGNGNGYTFKNYNANDMMYAVKRAYKDFENKDIWNELIKRAMTSDFSWEKSAGVYTELYKSLL